MEIIVIVLCVTIVILSIIGAILLLNFMQLLSTLNKRLVFVIGDILSDIDLSPTRIASLDDTNNVSMEDIIDTSDIDSEGFNPHNFDPFQDEETE